MPNKQLRIAIDANEANVHQRVGSNVYAFELLAALYKQVATQSDLSCTLLLSRPPIDDLPAATATWHYEVIGPRQFWTQWALPRYLFAQRANFDVFFTPGHYAPRFCPVPYISSVMDTAYLDFPDQFTTMDLLQLKHWTAFSVKRASRVVAISKATEQSVVQAYGLPRSRVVVAYPGFVASARGVTHNRQALILKELGVREPYFLFIGTIQPRKNLEKLIESYETFVRMYWGRTLNTRVGKKTRNKQPAPQLVIAGKTGWLAQPVIDRIQNSSERDSIVLTGFVSDEQKQALLRQAVATVLIGLHEGFGIPPLESMAVGTLPIVANSTSLPEVVGEAGLCVDPHDATAVAQAFWHAYTLSAKERAVYRRLMREQVAQFTWENAAEVVLGTIRDVAGER